jgi:transposase
VVPHPPAESDGFVTVITDLVITDLTAVVDGTGPARRLDLVPGRSAAAMRSWLHARDQAFRDQAFRDGIAIVAMDGYGGYQGYKNAATEALPDAVTVMDRFHVLALAGAKLDLCRQPIQQATLGHRGRTGDPLYRVRRTLRTRLGLLTDRQRGGLEAVFAADDHVAVAVTWWSYQQIIARSSLPTLIPTHSHPDPQRGKTLRTAVIDQLRIGPPAGLEELATLGRTLHRRRDDVLAYFTHRASNGPTEAINGRLEALRRNALGFRNLINYRIRSLLHCGALALQIRKSPI